MISFARYLMLLAIAAALAGAASAQTPSPYKAVLVAGEKDVPVFDHATAAMRDELLARRVDPGDIQRLSATPAIVVKEGLPPSDLADVLTTIAGMKPADGQACMVFVTSHGAPKLGLYLAPRDEFLNPVDLDRALTRGCGEAPTVVIASGCFSGNFARPPMARANRIVLTAARPDRPSFGCGAGFDYTVYDRCLLRAIDRSAKWRDVYASTRACVMAAERAMHFQPSGPQASFGADVVDLAVPGRG